MDLVLQIAGIIAPLFVIAGIGFLWGRSGRPFDTTIVGMLTLNFGVPALIFSTLTKLEVSLGQFGEIIGIFGIFLLANLAIGALLLRAFKLEIGAFLPAISFPNNGNMGLPLCLFNVQLLPSTAPDFDSPILISMPFVVVRGPDAL